MNKKNEYLLSRTSCRIKIRETKARIVDKLVLREYGMTRKQCRKILEAYVYCRFQEFILAHAFNFDDFAFEDCPPHFFTEFGGVK